VTVSAQSLANSFNLGATLERDAADDGAVARIGVGCWVGLVVVQENFADPAIRESPYCGGVP
jgi:hypothetical protein